MKKPTLILDWNGVIEAGAKWVLNAKGQPLLVSEHYTVAPAAVARLADYYDIVVATASNYKDYPMIKACLKEFFPAIRDVIFTWRKDLLNAAVQVDDNHWNLGQNNAIPVLFDETIATGFVGDMYVVNNWRDLEQFLTYLAIELKENAI